MQVIYSKEGKTGQIRNGQASQGGRGGNGFERFDRCYCSVSQGTMKTGELCVAFVKDVKWLERLMSSRERGLGWAMLMRGMR